MNTYSFAVGLSQLHNQKNKTSRSVAFRAAPLKS